MLPPVYSTIIPDGARRPDAAARSMTDSAILSFMLPVGFWPSTFTRMRAQPSGTTRFSSTSGVLPMASSTCG